MKSFGFRGSFRSSAAKTLALVDRRDGMADLEQRARPRRRGRCCLRTGTGGFGCNGSTARCVSGSGRRLSALTVAAFRNRDRRWARRPLIGIGRKRQAGARRRGDARNCRRPFLFSSPGHTHMPLASPRTGGKAQRETDCCQGVVRAQRAKASEPRPCRLSLRRARGSAPSVQDLISGLSSTALTSTFVYLCRAYALRERQGASDQLSSLCLFRLSAPASKATTPGAVRDR